MWRWRCLGKAGRGGWSRWKRAFLTEATLSYYQIASSLSPLSTSLATVKATLALAATLAAAITILIEVPSARSTTSSTSLEAIKAKTTATKEAATPPQASTPTSALAPAPAAPAPAAISRQQQQR